jgi:ribosomal protein S18 acetylase RimI-like enzyme
MNTAVGASLRYATHDDMRAIIDLVNLAFQVESAFKRTPRTDDHEVMRRLEAGRFLLLEQSGKLLANLYMELRGHIGYLGMLAVAPSHQRLGLGARMMREGESLCREAGCTQAEITVLDRRTELPPMYEKLGYRVAGTAPWAHGPGHFAVPCDLIVMRKPLLQG